MCVSAALDFLPAASVLFNSVLRMFYLLGQVLSMMGGLKNLTVGESVWERHIRNLGPGAGDLA